MSPMKLSVKIVFLLRHKLIALFEFASKRGITYRIPTRDGAALYLERMRLHPRWVTLGFFRNNIHKFHRSDDPADGVHDHPWPYRTVILKGSYIEHFADGRSLLRCTGDTVYAQAEHLHRVELLKDEDGKERPVYTFFTMGRRRRKVWGFLVNGRWYSWDLWTKARKANRGFALAGQDPSAPESCSPS